MNAQPENIGAIRTKPVENASETVIDMMAAIDKGQFIHSLEHSLREVVMACHDTEKAGVVTVKIKITPKKNSDCVFVAGEIQTKIPKQDLRESIFFTNTDGSLSRTDIRQPDMFVPTQNQ